MLLKAFGLSRVRLGSERAREKGSSVVPSIAESDSQKFPTAPRQQWIMVAVRRIVTTLGSRLVIVSRFIQESSGGDTRTYPATAIIV